MLEVVVCQNIKYFSNARYLLKINIWLFSLLLCTYFALLTSFSISLRVIKNFCMNGRIKSHFWLCSWSSFDRGYRLIQRLACGQFETCWCLPSFWLNTNLSVKPFQESLHAVVSVMPCPLWSQRLAFLFANV